MDVVSTTYLEPIAHSNARTVFQLPHTTNETQLSNLRVCDVAITITGTGSYAFPSYGGVYSLLSRATIADANGQPIEIVDNIDSFGVLHKLVVGDNGMQRDVNAVMEGLSNSYDVSQDETINSDGTLSQNVSVIGSSRYMMDLTKVFNYLRSTRVLQAGMRITLEYATDAASKLRSLSNPAVQAIAITISAPVLAVDMVDMKAPALDKVQYTQHFVEKVYVNGAGNGVVQNVDTKLQSVQGKFVRRAFLYVAPQTTNAAAGKTYAAPQYRESVNLTLNGVRLLPFQGYSSQVGGGQQEKLRSFTDAVGVCNLFQGVNLVSPSAGTTLLRGTVGATLAPACFQVNNKISDLQLNYQREGNAAIGQTGALIAYIVNEVVSVHDVKNGVVVYA